MWMCIALYLTYAYTYTYDRLTGDVHKRLTVRPTGLGSVARGKRKGTPGARLGATCDMRQARR